MSLNEHLNEILQKRHSEYKEYISREQYQFSNDDTKPIAFYLPQFHSFEENDMWWGKGFTEWTNVSKARPQFEGHYQPRLPGELGYYNVLQDGVMKRQIELAQMYGIYGFCFHFYMFDNRKRLLEKPLNKFLEDKSLNMPFCLCYANENWTRRWDGMENDVLMKQSYGENFEQELALELEPYIKDDRYIKIDNKPLVIIYRINIIPDIDNFALKLRKAFKKIGIEEIYLCSVLTFEISNVDSRKYGFDDCLEFPLHGVYQKKIADDYEVYSEDYQGQILSYPYVVESEMEKEIEFPRFRGCMPMWDNEARKFKSGFSFHGSTPKLYMKWLHDILVKTRKERDKNKRYVFINAWNEWAEGAYLEPDRRYGYAYLEATFTAVSNQEKLLKMTEDKVQSFEEELSNSYCELFPIISGQLDIKKLKREYFSSKINGIKFNLTDLSLLTQIRIDFTNFPAVVTVESVKIYDVSGTSYELSVEWTNANDIEGTTFTYLHDDPINVYSLEKYGEKEWDRVEVKFSCEPLKGTEVRERLLKKAEENRIKSQELTNIYNSKSWKISQFMLSVARKLRVVK